MGGAFLAPFAKAVVEGKFDGLRRVERHRDELVDRICVVIRNVSDDSTLYWAQSAADLGPQDELIAARLGAALYNLNGLICDLFSDDQQLLELTRDDYLDAADWVGCEFGNADRSAETSRLTAIYTSLYTLERQVRARRMQLKRSMVI